MNPGDLETSAVFRELVDEVRALEAKLYDGPNAPRRRAVGARGVQVDLLDPAGRVRRATCGRDPANPRFVDIVGPYKKWGGDNADAFYQYAPDRPDAHLPGRGPTRATPSTSRSRSTAVPTTAATPSASSARVNDRDARHRADGTFELVPQPDEPHDGPWLEARARRRVRDHARLPRSTRSPAGGSSGTSRPSTRRRRTAHDDAELARRFRAARTWLRDQAQIVPLALGEPNTVDEPYPVPQQTFGWAAGDAAYAMGSFDLADDEALVIRGRSPECAFWNLCLWNPFLHTYNYDYERVTINGGQVAYEADGSWTIVVADRDPGHPNWVSTAGPPPRPDLVPLVLPGRDARPPDDRGRQGPLTFWEAKRLQSDRFAAGERGGDVADQARWEYLVRRLEATRSHLSLPSLSERKRVASAGAGGVATACHGSGRAAGSSSRGRSVVRSGDRVAPAGPGLLRDRSPSALGAGVHSVRSGHHLVPVAGERDGRRRSDAGEEPRHQRPPAQTAPVERHRRRRPCQARPAALGGVGRDWAALSVREGGRCARPGAHPRTVRPWLHAATDAFSGGVPLPGVSPPRHLKTPLPMKAPARVPGTLLDPSSSRKP